MSKNNDLLWLVMTAGLVLGAVLTIAGLATMSLNGPVLLIVGLVVLAFGAGAFFTRQARSN